ncbi:DUF6186 family protein [Catenuloplanes atrovinosus]|uniref:Uncharacterized protein n=1 Tax=Catenuloplanes atrovinosus TaxID=137266 RepID=A0AAE3YJK3_9ACTN|nr:DUF6186 family protein [Catenuloplanes atrovinosus]MDR7273393.1 hypothetical protein [Catenuloplanes atrovinosus]
MTRAIAIGGFVLAGLLVVALELAARRDGSRVPTFGDLCAYVMRYQVGRVPVGRIGILGFWWWLGWHFFAR